MKTNWTRLATALCVTGMSTAVFAASPRHDDADGRRDGPDPRRDAPGMRHDGPELHRDMPGPRHDEPELHRDMPGPRHDEPFHGRPGSHLWRLPGPAIRIVIGDRPHYYFGGSFYVIDNDGYVVVDPPMGAYVPVLPSDCNTISVGGMTYFVSGTTYFRRFGGGYIVVTRPVMTAGKVLETQSIPEPTAGITSAGQAWTVWITNPNGSKTSVVLRAAEGGQWVGQKGEYYDSFPSEAQLLSVYGLGMVEAAPAPQAPVQRETVVWIKNPNGSKSKVVLKAGENDSWLGPRGESYDSLPTEDQLRSVYGVSGPVAVETATQPPTAKP